MPYIGNGVGNRFVASKAASVYSGDGSTTAFTLEHAVGSDEDILVSVDGVIQEPSVAYAVSSGTTLTFTAAPSTNSGNNIFVYYLFRTVATVDHPATSALSATTGTFTGAVTLSGGVSGALTANAGVVVDNITIDGTEIDLSSGDLTLDVAGNILLNADGGGIYFQDASVLVGSIQNSSSDLVITSEVQDKDILFKGDDGGSAITALKLDMSAAGDATFNQNVFVTNIYGNNDANTGIQWEGSDVLTFHAGGVENIQLTSNAIVFNQDSVDMDFRVESNGVSAMLFVDGGNNAIGIGTDSPSATLHLETSSAAHALKVTHTENADKNLVTLQHTYAQSSQTATMIQFRDSGGSERGSIKTNGSATSFNTSSDYRLKENVAYDFDATTRLKQLKPCRFNFITDSDTTVDGFLAHEVSSIVPEAISGEKDAMQVETRYTEDDAETQGDNPTKSVSDVKTYSTTKIAPQSIDQSKIVPLLTKVLQEQQATIEALTARIVTLEKA